MATKTMFDQIGGQIPTAASFSQGMAFEFVHDATGQRDIDAVRLGRIGNSGTAWNAASGSEALLQLLNQVFQNWDDIVSIQLRKRYFIVLSRVFV